MLTQEQFIRNFNVMADGEVDFFIGAGASIASGIPTGGDLIWEFKRNIYCSECGISVEKYKDVALPSTRAMLQKYFDQKGTCPIQYAPEEYSFYFEQCYNNPLARKRFIEMLVSKHEPSLGYLCMAEAIVKGKVKNVWTTNFDSLLERAIHTLYPLSSILIFSEANKNSIDTFNPAFPVIGKLHGDYRYDWLRNTEQELQQLEARIKSCVSNQLQNKQLVVIGYSGNDESIMSLFESNIDNPAFLSKGLIWAIRKDGYVSQRVLNLIERTKSSGKPADFVEIDSFDSLMYSIYQVQNFNSEIIEGKKNQLLSCQELSFSGETVNSFVKLNAYKAEGRPLCNVFKTDITNWKDLRSITSGTDIIAALFNGHIYSFSSNEMLKKSFGKHILFEINREEVPDRIIYKQDSIYLGLIYELIGSTLSKKGMVRLKKDKFYDPGSLTLKDGYKYFDALEYALSYIEGVLYLNLMPTVHVLDKSGNTLNKESYQFQVNKAISSIYNRQYNDNLRKWESRLNCAGKFIFEHDGFQISFDTPAFSFGGMRRNAGWPTLPAYMFAEPIMCFSSEDKTKQTVSQLKGLCKYGPLDYSYANDVVHRPAVRLAVLAPKEDMRKVLSHLNSLNNTSSSKGKDAFLVNYEGFERVYRRSLAVPTEQEKERCIGYNGHNMAQKSAIEFLDFLKRGIDWFSQRVLDFDILVVYIPRYFSQFRMAKSISSDFNLHDAVKLYATDKSVKLQIIEERSINAYDPCKVIWGLSTSLYAKAAGVLWQPEEIQDNTAYIGISYSYSNEKGICIGCSQLFDSTGTGIRMVLRKISNPIFRGKSNPYMRSDDARTMMTELREQYYHSNPVSNLKRVVIHKTTPFISDEIEGIMQAFRGIDDVELIQVQEYCPWRGIRFGDNPSQTAYPYAVKRGLTVKLDKNSFLLWTHGCILHPDLCGGNNYYKGSRGVPSPLLVKRFSGKCSGDILAQEILMLTKMNWNSGDSLYKTLPVTLDFAKVLARMSKQDEAIYDKAYDFRYFM